MEEECDLAQFDDLEDDDMDDVGCENVQLKGVRTDKGRLAVGPTGS